MPPRLRGLSLIETIIATFLLVGGFLITVALFHSSLRYTTQIERVSIASLLGERTVHEIQSWARNLNNYRSSWSAYDGATRVDPSYPEHRILTEVSKNSGGPPHPLLASPCTALENLQAVGQRKTLANSCRRVRITVGWPPYTPGSQLRMQCLVPEPRLTWRATNPIVVTLSGAGPLSHNETTTVTAQGFDSTGTAIPDLVYNFYVQPDVPPTMASITQNRQGTSATLTHVINLLNGSSTFGPTGRVIVAVRAVYKGEERWGKSGPISLI